MKRGIYSAHTTPDNYHGVHVHTQTVAYTCCICNVDIISEFAPRSCRRPDEPQGRAQPARNGGRPPRAGLERKRLGRSGSFPRLRLRCSSSASSFSSFVPPLRVLFLLLLILGVLLIHFLNLLIQILLPDFILILILISPPSPFFSFPHIFTLIFTSPPPHSLFPFSSPPSPPENRKCLCVNEG